MRTISAADFAAVIEAAALTDTLDDPKDTSVTPIRYASAESIRAIERFAVNAAMKELRQRYPNAPVRELPRNNPGYDIEIDASEGLLYVEVKGTERAGVQFFVTEGELQFSRAHANQYRLIVVYQINRETGAYFIFWHDGPIIAGSDFRLQPIQWLCELGGVSLPVLPSDSPPLPQAQ